MSDPRSPLSGVIGVLSTGRHASVERDKTRLNEIDTTMSRLSQQGKMDTNEYKDLSVEKESILTKYD